MPDMLSRQDIPDAERERGKADEHGFRASYRTVEAPDSQAPDVRGKAAKGPPFTAEDARVSNTRALAEVFPARVDEEKW